MATIGAHGPASVLADRRAVLRASTTLTASYVASTNSVNVTGRDVAHIHIAWVKGDETSMEVIVEVSSDNGTTYDEIGFTAVPTAGVTVVSDTVLQFATASNTGTNIRVALDKNFHLLRTSEKATAGTPTGTRVVLVTVN